MEGLPEPHFDAVVPYHVKDSEILPYCIESLRRFAKGLRKIYVISREQPDVDAVWIPESKFPFTIENVEKVVGPSRRGWYYQQLLKYYAHEVVPDLETYLMVDSDVVFLRPVSFFREEAILFDYGGIYHEPYFHHMKRLLPKAFPTFLPEVGTTDCMMYQREIMEDLHSQIESQNDLPTWKAMLRVVDPDSYDGSGMSEQEIYFQFARQHYPSFYELRLLTKFQGFKLGELARIDADFLTFHAWAR